MKLNMKSPVFRIGIFFVLFCIPAYVYAQSVGASGLVPCGAVTSANYFNPMYYLSATSCNFCYLAKLIQNVVNFLVMVTIPISVAMFAWAGIMFFTATGNPKKIARAKGIFSSVFIGFIITIAGWLVVQIVLQTITNGGFYSANNWVNLDCSEYNQFRLRNADVSQILTPAPTANIPTSPSPTPGTPSPSPIPSATPDVSTAVQAMCQIESGCGQNVDNGNGTGCNSAGACGPMQIKPDTACATNPGYSSGCNSDGTVLNRQQVVLDLQSVQNSEALAAQFLTRNQNSSQCAGSLDCAIALYSGDPTALNPSACCAVGQAYQCPYDCGSTVPRSASCDVNPTSACRPAATCTAASNGNCTAYGYIQLVHNGGR